MRPEEWHYIEAQRRAEKVGVLSGSHRKMDANQVGCLGEVMFEQYLKDHSISFKSHLKETSHDYLVGQRQLVMEVKTKDRTVAPLPSYECSAPMYNIEHQRVQAYAFFSLQRERGSKNDIRRFHTCWFVGVISHQRFDKASEVREAGETDYRNGTTFWTSCKNVYIRDLYDPRLLVQYAK
jgi:hypothetical protein